MTEVYDFYRFRREGMIPLYVGEEIENRHPEKLFHSHNFSELVLVLNGEAVHLSGGQKCVVKRGDVLSLHPGVVHAYDNCRSFKIINVLYDCKSLAMPVLDTAHISAFHRLYPIKHAVAPEMQNAPVVNLNDEKLAEIRREVERLKTVLEQMRPGCLFTGLAIFMQIISQISLWCESSVAEYHAAIQIDKAIAYMTENYDSNISLEQLLKKSNMSRRNFYRHFNNLTGSSPVEYLIQLRVCRAVELLRNSDASVSEIAQLCGFTESNYMCRVFRRRYGISPGAFRKKIRKEGSVDKSVFEPARVIVRKEDE